MSLWSFIAIESLRNKDFAHIVLLYGSMGTQSNASNMHVSRDPFEILCFSFFSYFIMPSVVCCIRSCRWIRKRLHVFASTFVVAGWVARLVLADALVFWWRIYSFINLISFFYSSSLQVVHPKSDQQRHRLAEAVKNIFIFRSLDPVHISPPDLLPCLFIL